MNERSNVMGDETVKFGLLMESAQTHQKLAEDHLEKLRAHTQDLDGVVREEIRRTLIDELQALTAESKRAARALQGMKRAANMRGALWSIGIAILCTAIPSAIARWALPSASEIAALRAKRDELASSVWRFEQQGGRIDWRRCGAAQRLCVRVERRLPAYGNTADYYIVKGY
jgi:hypothetical protein